MIEGPSLLVTLVILGMLASIPIIGKGLLDWIWFEDTQDNLEQKLLKLRNLWPTDQIILKEEYRKYCKLASKANDPLDYLDWLWLQINQFDYKDKGRGL